MKVIDLRLMISLYTDDNKLRIIGRFYNRCLVAIMLGIIGRFLRYPLY